MSSQTIIIIIAVAVVFAIAVGALRGGPRVTQITRTVKRDEPGEGE
jgi:hypothetical protein